MITFLYAIKDAKSGYDKVFTSINDAYASRDFSVAVKDSGSLFNQYPDDFCLYRVGTFDTKDGSITSDMALVTSAVDILGGVSIVQD